MVCRCDLRCVTNRWEAFFGSALDVADDLSETFSQVSLRSAKSTLSRKQQATPVGAKSPGHASNPPNAGFVSPPLSQVRATARVIGDGGGLGSSGRLIATIARVPGEGAGDEQQQPLLNDGASELSRDVGGLALEEGWDENFVYKVGWVAFNLPSVN